MKRRRRRRTRRPGNTGIDIGSIIRSGIWVVLGVSAVILFFFAFWQGDKGKGFDEITLCPQEEKYIVSDTVVLLDLVKPVPSKQMSNLERLIKGFKNKESDVYIPPQGRVTVYYVPDVIDGIISIPEESVISFCNPGNPDDRHWTDEFKHGPKVAEDNWNIFKANLESLYPKETSREHNYSPILETIATIVPRHKSFSKEGKEERLHLVIWSDLLQHTTSESGGLSHFRQYPDPNQVLNDWAYGGLRTDLEDINISLFRLRNSNHSRRQTQKQQLWWTEILKGMGANIILDESI